jgi:lysophospholipase L1-like esterase
VPQTFSANLPRHLLALCVPLCTAAAVSSAAEPMRFQLAGDEPASGAIRVSADTLYESEKGYGFEPTMPNSFSVRVPAEGNYRVNLTLGDAPDAGLTVKAEQRRLMVEQRRTTADAASRTASFVVNVRNGTIATGGEVKLRDRELQTRTWDDKLTLEFLPDPHSVQAIDIAPASDVTTVYLAGDSTVTDQGGEPYCGWGQMLPRFFDGTVAVANHAESGRTLRSFRGDRRLDKILSLAKAGDYVFIQFGHNDMKEKGEGIGALTSYKKDLESYVGKIKETGATPVLVTSMYRRRFSPEGQLQDTLGDYPLASRQVAQEQGLTLIDLHEMSGKVFSALGTEPSKKAFLHFPAGTFPGQKDALKDDTHFSAYGGYELARCVVEGIRTSNLPLAKQLASDVPPFDPAKPDDVNAFSVPASAPRAADKPEGS